MLSAGGGKGRSWKWKEMLRFPQINQCVDLAMNIGVCVHMSTIRVLDCFCDFTSCFNILRFSVRARLLQSVCEAADRKETVPAFLSESA